MMDRKSKTEDGTVPHFPKETALLDFCAFIAEYKDAFFETEISSELPALFRPLQPRLKGRLVAWSSLKLIYEQLC